MWNSCLCQRFCRWTDVLQADNVESWILCSVDSLDKNDRNVSHRNQEISFLVIRKRQNKVNISLKPQKSQEKKRQNWEQKDHKTNTKQGQITKKNTWAVWTMLPIIPVSRANDRITCMIVVLYNNFLTDFISCLQMVKGGLNTNLCILSFCCKSRSNWKTQPCYWLATNKNTKGKNTEQKHTRG
jgi:hypothetical protein